MTKSKSIFVLCLAILIVIFSGCSKQENKSMSQLQTNTTVADAVETTTEEKKETEIAIEKKSNSESTTIKSEFTTKKSGSSDTTAKPAEQKSAGRTTTKKQSETTTKKVDSQTTATNRETTKAVVATKKETTTKKQTTTEKPFDINYWVNYAKNYAESIGLNLDSSATECWDNPINANTKCIYLERDIQSRLNRYAKDDDITDVWIWTKKVSGNSYQIYIGYA